MENFSRTIPLTKVVPVEKVFLFDNGSSVQPGNRTQDILERYGISFPMPGPRCIGVSKEVDVTYTIARGVAPNSEISKPLNNLFLQ